MKKIISLILAALVVATLFAGCGQKAEKEESAPEAAAENAPAPEAAPEGGEAAEPAEPAADTLVIKCGTPAGDSAPHSKALEFMNEYLSQKGIISIDVYPNSALGAERELPESVSMGTVDMAVVSSSPLANYSGSMYVLDLPFMVTVDREEALAVLNGEQGRALADTLLPSNIYLLGFWDQGFRQFENNVRECKTLEDVKGLKIRIVESDIFQKLFTAAGVYPTTMSGSEVITALEQGTIDGVDMALSAIYSGGFYVGLKHVLLTNHVYATLAPIINLDLWNSMTEEQKAELQAAMDYSVEKMIEYMNGVDNDTIEQLLADGFTVNEANIDEWKAVTQPIWDDYKDQIDPEIFDSLSSALSAG